MTRNALLKLSLARRPGPKPNPGPSVWSMTAALLGMIFVGARPGRPRDPEAGR